ncbi:UNVERIFIED_ORG: hypothetical protein J2W85_002821 [Ensifer adhaerens]|nr:hypothetical protein [Ensifer adhaerens]
MHAGLAAAVRKALRDSGQFARLQAACVLLKDLVRRKIHADTGYDPQLAEPRDLKGLMMQELDRHRGCGVELASPSFD